MAPRIHALPRIRCLLAGAARPCRRLVFAVIVVALTQVLEARQDPHDLKAWMTAVRDHTPGNSDEPVARIATWSERELLDAIRRLPPARDADTLQLVKRALVLHTDIAVLRHRVAGYDLPPMPGATTVVGDGLRVGESAGTYHWEVARKLATALVDADPLGRDGAIAARAWFRAGAAILQRWGEYPELNVQLDRGASVLGADVILLLYEGTKHQDYASPTIQAYIERERGAAGAQRARPGLAMAARPSRPDSRLPGTVIDERSLAETAFRSAITRDPGLVEARIRLGHVLGDRGEHADAVRELRHALGGSLGSFLDYYASLVLGREEQALGHADLAVAAYQHAAVRYPKAQSPRLALSQLALLRADRGDVHLPLLEILRPRPDGGDDPWWEILRVHEPSAETLLGAMRRAFTQ